MLPAIALIITYCIAIIACCGGAGPIGLLLVMGSWGVWGLGQLLGWCSIILLVFVTVRFRSDIRNRAFTQLLASVGLYLSWFAFVYTASIGSVFWGNVWGHFEFSAPFQVTFVAVGIYLFRKIRAPHKEKQTPVEFAKIKVQKYLSNPIQIDVFCKKHGLSEEDVQTKIRNGEIKAYEYKDILFIENGDDTQTPREID